MMDKENTNTYNSDDDKPEKKHVTREDRIAVFRDTMNWINRDPYLSGSVAEAKKNTEIFYEDDYPEFYGTQEKGESISVTKERSYEAAMRLAKEKPDSRIAVMNFANAFHAGGGVTRGAGAQEESLCRCSTLYPLLYRRTLRDTFYRHHHELNTSKASDSLIYTEGVVICKTDEDIPERMDREDWVNVDVITIAAPDLRRKSNIFAKVVGSGTYMNDAELFGYHVKRAIHMLTVAASKGTDVLEVSPKVFEKIVFAVYCTPRDANNYEAFREVFESEEC